MRLILYFIITILLIILVLYGSKIVSTYMLSNNAKIVLNWFVTLAIMNILIFMFILYSYDTLKFKRGPRGPSGMRGEDGPTGKSGSCVMCGPAVSGLKPKRPFNKIDRIDPMTPEDEREKLFTRTAQKK